MPDYLNEFRTFFPQPSEPIENKGSWRQVEDELGTPLPSDYKQFIDEYGRGILLNLFWVFTPFPSSPTGGVLTAIDEIFAGYRIVSDTHSDICPYKLFPHDGGLLPFAQSDNGDELHWLTKGQPDDWHVVMSNLSAMAFHEYEGCSFSKFMCEIASGRLKSPLIPERFVSASPRFMLKGRYSSASEG